MSKKQTFAVPVNIFVDAETPAEAYGLAYNLLNKGGLAWESHDEIFDENGHGFCTQKAFDDSEDIRENSENYP